MPYFICPNCAKRTFSKDRTAGFSTRPKGCERCGFGFLFELLDDYYPAPTAAFFTCDQEGRILDCGKGSYELTALKDEEVMGSSIAEALGLDFADGTDHIGKALEWGVRALEKPVSLSAGGGHQMRAVADIFPAYDEDGGLLVVLTPAAL